MKMKPEKIHVALALLERGSLFVHFDPRMPGAVVPVHLRAQSHVVMQFGLNMPIPIHDMVVDERGISGTLSFARVPWPVVIPWSAVYALVGDDARGIVFDEAKLRELHAPAPTGLAPPAPSKPGRSHLRLVGAVK